MTDDAQELTGPITSATPPLTLVGGNLALQWEGPPLDVQPTAFTSEAPNARLRFWMVRHVAAMGVDNTNVVGMDYTDLPDNIAMVEWKQGVGEIEYNDRPRLRENFIDVTPYCPFFQQFMERLPRLTLAQAKKIQCDLIDVLFDSKRQMPYAYAIASGNYTWDATDGSVAHMAATTIPSITGSVAGGTGSLVDQINNQNAALVAQLNSQKSSFVTQINGAISSFNNNIEGAGDALVSGINANIVNAVNAGFNEVNAEITAQANALFAWMSTNWIGYSGDTLNTISNRLQLQTFGDPLNITAAAPGLAGNLPAIAGSQYFGSVAATAIAVGYECGDVAGISVADIATNPISPGAGPGAATIQFMPIEGTAPVNVTVTEMGSIMSGIETRRNNLMTTQRTKKNAVNALTTIAAVIAYDVTAGWPS
jgi:hypothetical protein